MRAEWESGTGVFNFPPGIQLWFFLWQNPCFFTCEDYLDFPIVAAFVRPADEAILQIQNLCAKIMQIKFNILFFDRGLFSMAQV